MIIKREIGEKGQVVIPKDIREHLGLKIGEKVVFEVKDDKVTLKKEESERFLEEFLDVPNKLRRPISTKEIKKIILEQYDEEIH